MQSAGCTVEASGDTSSENGTGLQAQSTGDTFNWVTLRSLSYAQ